MILKPAAALCVGWAITLIGKKLDGSKLSMLVFYASWIVLFRGLTRQYRAQFGQDGAEKLTDDEKEQLLAIFRQDRSSSG